MPDRQAMAAICFILRSLGAASTVHDRCQTWREASVCERMWCAGLLASDQQVGIDWAWQTLDDAMTNAPLEGGEGTGRDPTDRGNRGTNRSLLTAGHGMPLASTVDGANRHDRPLG